MRDHETSVSIVLYTQLSHVKSNVSTSLSIYCTCWKTNIIRFIWWSQIPDRLCEVIYLTSYRLYLSAALERQKKVVYCNKSAESGESSVGLTIHSLARPWLSVTSHTLSCSISVSPHRWNCFQGKGKKQKSFTLILLCHKIKLSHALGTIVLPLAFRQKVAWWSPIAGAQ